MLCPASAFGRGGSWQHGCQAGGGADCACLLGRAESRTCKDRHTTSSAGRSWRWTCLSSAVLPTCWPCLFCDHYLGPSVFAIMLLASIRSTVLRGVDVWWKTRQLARSCRLEISDLAYGLSQSHICPVVCRRPNGMPGWRLGGQLACRSGERSLKRHICVCCRATQKDVAESARPTHCHVLHW